MGQSPLHMLYLFFLSFFFFNAAKLLIKLLALSYLTVSFVTELNQSEIVIKNQSIGAACQLAVCKVNSAVFADTVISHRESWKQQNVVHVYCNGEPPPPLGDSLVSNDAFRSHTFFCQKGGRGSFCLEVR